jgi:hypothetical protein
VTDRGCLQSGRNQGAIHRRGDAGEVGGDPGLEVGARDRLVDGQLLVPEDQARRALRR